eukprot:13690084-Ditylum_brightwellii.AAC.1
MSVEFKLKRKKRKVAEEHGRGQKTLQSDTLKRQAILDKVEFIGEEGGDEDEMESSNSSSNDKNELAYK